MKLAAGMDGGPAEVVAPIGAGGIGRRCRARDRRRGRIEGDPDDSPRDAPRFHALPEELP